MIRYLFIYKPKIATTAANVIDLIVLNFLKKRLVVMWMSGPALSMLDVNVMHWDEGPGGDAP